MRHALLSSLALLATVATAAAQTPSAAPAPAAQPALQAGNPNYNISTFSDLVRLCGTDRNDSTFQVAVGLCAGYISGVLDYHLVDTGWSGGRRGRRVCLPDQRPTRLEALQSLVSWDQANAQYNEQPAADGVMRYFMSTYPCQSTNARSTTRSTKPPG